MNLDITVFRLVNNFFASSELLSYIAFFCGVYLAWLVLIFFIYVVYKREKKDSLGLYIEALISALVARFVVGSLLKALIARPRPFMALPHVSALVVETGYSMPSGHATFFFALATYLLSIDRKWGTVFLTLATVISIGRVAVGVHYPSDILAGAILGSTLGIFAVLVRRTWFK